MNRLGAALFVVGVVAACSNIPGEGPSCLETQCNMHGTCSIAGLRPACVCEPGYAGPACAACAAGYQDNDGNGFCAPACGETSCGAHERCSDASGRAVCVCVVGYSRIPGGACHFTGGPVDPEFSRPELDAWRERGQARVDRSTVVGRRGGWARFSGFGEVFQTFEMPAYADAEPLALELELDCVRGGACANARRWLSIVFDGWLADQAFFSQGGQTTTRRICLGERAFGRSLTFGLRAYPAGTAGGEREDALIGRARFVPSPACPRPGIVTNGDFEQGGWSADDWNGNVIEEGGTRLGRLVRACAPGQPAVMTTSMSVPEHLTRPAVAFSLEGTRDELTYVEVDGARVAQVRGTGAREDVVVCLPRSTSGLALRLGVEAALPCPGDRNAVQVDDFVLRSEPSCRTEGVGDGGFELRGPVSPWQGTPHRVAVVREPISAHSGVAFLRLEAPCDAREEVSWGSTMLHVPPRPADAAGGAALKLWYRLSTPALVDVTAGEVGASGRRRLPPAPAWTEAVFCLPSHSWGRETGVQIDLAPAPTWDGDCAPAHFDLDDLSIAPDPSCPLE
ncbi:MAG: hypothetical protein KF782_10805 [Labilithrix sp.]|nr:hypothetical protein [Labilithrix sp.]